MTELKTLKDLEEDNTKETSILTVKNIREEAIKWVKMCRKESLKGNEDTKLCWDTARNILENFFNLTEEDLK